MIWFKWSAFSFPWRWRLRVSRRGVGGWAVRWGYGYLRIGADID
jgi:hypothetical protein